MINTIVLPEQKFHLGLSGSANPFRDKFGQFDDETWRNVLLRSLHTRIIEDIEFPGMPSPELQTRIHGHSAEVALNEAFGFYSFIKDVPALKKKFSRESNFLDFGSGWGRITRPFMREFDLNRMFGYEPYIGFCAIARVLNPYVCFMNGDYLPDGTLPPERFDLVVGWSVFSHLPPDCAAAWLEEMVRVVRAGGYCVFTTWGERFFERLIREHDELKAGMPINWYSKACLEAAGDIMEKRELYRRGEFVWFTGTDSKLFGEAFIPQRALRGLLRAHEIGLELVAFDQHSLPQDVFILRRR